MQKFRAARDRYRVDLSRRLYLVIAAAAATYEHAAQLIHARALLRADPDYIEHRGKRVTMILLANKVEPPIADFARRQRVRILIAPVSSAMGDASPRAYLPMPDHALAPRLFDRVRSRCQSSTSTWIPPIRSAMTL